MQASCAPNVVIEFGIPFGMDWLWLYPAYTSRCRPGVFGNRKGFTMRRLTAILLTVLSSGLPMSSLADGSEAKAGERYVGFTLPDIDTGKPVSLSDFRGKKVLLIQFASW